MTTKKRPIWCLHNVYNFVRFTGYYLLALSQVPES